ncbi:MAG: nickel-type superoxide dismutase maturation protease [Caldilineaceae bacterium]|nr:nickel-type superoxide dismutase maturation protease [Caldilineaceae bacterium]MDE0339533.1 nickel-type superoxide dismutase maturation protease [Caldilineaceae bacterium]
MEGELPRSGWREMALWLFRKRRLFRVTGDSMAPTLASGAVVMLDPRAYRSQSPQEDEIVVTRHPRNNELQIVKRVAAVIESRTENSALGIGLLLASDNAAAGADSRSFGPVALDLVLGKVVSCLRR